MFLFRSKRPLVNVPENSKCYENTECADSMVCCSSGVQKGSFPYEVKNSQGEWEKREEWPKQGICKPKDPNYQTKLCEGWENSLQMGRNTKTGAKYRRFPTLFPNPDLTGGSRRLSKRSKSSKRSKRSKRAKRFT